MLAEYIRKAVWAVSVAAMISACASPPPPKPMTHEEWLIERERRIDEAVALAYGAGRDGAAVRSNLELEWCYRDAMALPDVAQRSPAVQQCRVMWPQPVVQQAVTTNCYSQGGVTQCTSQ